MNSRERFLAPVAGRRPDVVPVAPYMGNFGAALAGIPIDSYCRSARQMAEAQTRAWELCGQDAVVAQSDQYYIAEGFGTKVEHHEDATPTFASPALDDLDGVYDLETPDPLRDGRMPVYLEAIERLASRFKGEVLVRAPGTGPFSLASHLIGTSSFIMKLSVLTVEPDEDTERKLHHLMGIATEALIGFAEACIDAGADMVQAGDSLASLDMISPDMYEKWAWPYERRFFEQMAGRAAEHDTATLLHICGDTRRILPLMARTGASLIEIDHKVDLSEAREAVGDGVCLIGNLDPTGTLLQGAPDDVVRASKEAIRKAGQHGRFVLGSGCEVPPRASRENIRAMVETGHAYSYPGAVGA